MTATTATTIRSWGRPGRFALFLFFPLVGRLLSDLPTQAVKLIDVAFFLTGQLFAKFNPRRHFGVDSGVEK